MSEWVNMSWTFLILVSYLWIIFGSSTFSSIIAWGKGYDLERFKATFSGLYPSYAWPAVFVATDESNDNYDDDDYHGDNAKDNPLVKHWILAPTIKYIFFMMAMQLLITFKWI